MALKLYFHPLASFCHKALIALYENLIPFEPIIVDLRDEASSAAFRAVWPMAKMPVLHDEARNRTVAESTIIIEFLDAHYPGPTRFLPADVDRAWQTRMWDRFYDHYVQEPMQKICAAAPALFYANTVVPFTETHKNLGAYLDRLMARPSFARVLEEAQPYFHLFPLERKPTIARLGRMASR